MGLEIHTPRMRKLENTMSAITQRDQALAILDAQLKPLSKLYKECYLSQGRGALLLYASDVIANKLPAKSGYRTAKEILEIFDAPASHAELKGMIAKYAPKKEGILTLITDYANATFFITVKFDTP